MIYDDIRNAARYGTLPHMEALRAFIQKNDCLNLPNGELEILGRDLFVRTAEYDTGPAEEKKFEAHQIYADLQWVVQGAESMGVSISGERRVLIPYDGRADIHFFEEPEESFEVQVGAGQFTVFFPGELHKPGCWIRGVSRRVKKLVFKIRMGDSF